MRRYLCALAVLVASAFPAHAEREEEVLVAVAASAVPPMEAVAAAVKERHGLKVVLSQGSSGVLERQARQGAPFDLFVAADMATVERLAEIGIVTTESLTAYARGKLVLYFPKSSRHAPTDWDGLTSAIARGLRLSVANPETAPYGRAAMEALDALALPPVGRALIITGEDTRSAVQYADTGNTDAALVPLSLVIQSGGAVADVPEGVYTPVLQGMAILKESPNPRGARIVHEYVASSGGSALFAEYGYETPGGAGN